MNMINKILEVVRNRPTYLYPYARQTIRFYITRALFGILRPKGIELGNNVRVQAFSSLRVELPESRIRIGDHSVLWEACKIEAVGGGQIEIGAYSELVDVTIACKKLVKIGRHTLMASNTYIEDYLGHPTDPEHRKMERQMRLEWFSPRFATAGPKRPKRQEYDQQPKSVIIGDNVLIYRNCLIARGVTIGENSVVGAYSVVTKDIPPNSFAAGNPAAVIKRL